MVETCLQCKTDFAIERWRKGKAKYCSRSCKGTFERPNLWRGGSSKGRTYKPETILKFSNSHLGKTHTPETIEKIRTFHQANVEKHWRWKGGISRNPTYRSWQKNLWHHRKRAASGSHTFAEWDELKRKYCFTCPCCFKSEPDITLTIDHIVPLSKGGTEDIENIQPLCKSCNCRKSVKSTRY